MSMDNLRKGKRGSRASQLARFLHREGKKYCAVALCASLIAGNLGSSAVAADESDIHEFELDRVALYEALQEAVMADEIVDETFTFAGEAAETYDSLLNGSDSGNLYELKPEIEDNDGALKLRIFARLDGDIELESAYEIDGSEEMIFLLTNTSKTEKTAVICVDDKATEKIKVAPKGAVLSDGQLDAYKTASELAGPGTNGETAADGVVTSGGSGSGGSGGGGGSHKGGSGSGEETKASDEVNAADPEQDNTQAAGDDQETAEAQESGGTQDVEKGDESSKTDESADAGENGNQNPADEDNTTTDDGLTDDTKDDQSDVKDSDVSADDSEKDGTEDQGHDSSSQGQEAGTDQEEAGGEQAEADHDSQNDDGEAGGTEDQAGSPVAAVSYHETYRVAATPSNAEKEEADEASPSNATDSNADQNTLDGTPLEAVRLGAGATAVAFVTTLEQIGINAGGHLAPCEVGCSGRDCDCICHEMLHELLSELDAYVKKAQGYTPETDQELFDAVMAEVSELYERAQEAGLTDAEWEYFTEAYEEAFAKIAELRKSQEVTVILHDIQPDGTEAAEPIEVTAVANTTLKTAFSETKETLALTDCNWYEVDASTGERELVSLDAEAEAGMELYTYTYDVTLTVVKQASDQNAGIMTMALDDAETDTETSNEVETSLTLSARDGETLSASDFVKDDVDYSLYKWTTDTGENLDLQSLVENGVTENISATAYADNGIAAMSISGPTEVAVGETITLTSNQGDYSNSWKKISGSGDVELSGNRKSVSVTGVTAGEVTIQHQYQNSRWDWSQTETYTVTVTAAAGANEGALVYYLKSPTSDPDSNATNQWGTDPVKYNNQNATVNTAGASWTDNKNIFKQNADLTDYIILWPDGSTGDTWVLQKGQYDAVYQEVYTQYKADLESELGITDLRLEDIEEITLIPYKISKNNGSNPDKHIDCTISVKCSKAYVARFNVQMPNDTDYTNVHAEDKKIVNGTPDSVEKYVNETTVPATKVVDGITYVFDGWYDEAGNKIADTAWTNGYTPDENELADGTVNFYARYVRPSVNVSIKKIVSGIMGDRSRKFNFTVTSDAANLGGENSWEFEIGHNETTVLGSIPVGAKLTISEINADGYTMRVKGGTEEATATYTYTITETGEVVIEVTNEKTGIVDAGVLLDSLPYVLILAAAAAGVAFFVIRKRREDEGDLD